MIGEFDPMSIPQPESDFYEGLRGLRERLKNDWDHQDVLAFAMAQVPGEFSTSIVA